MKDGERRWGRRWKLDVQIIINGNTVLLLFVKQVDVSTMCSLLSFSLTTLFHPLLLTPPSSPPPLTPLPTPPHRLPQHDKNRGVNDTYR